MSFLESILLGIVQGITEFLPVSSSGHLAILRNLLGIRVEGGVLYDVLLHLGTLVAIILAFHKDVKRLILEGLRIVYDIYGNCKIFVVNRREGRNEAYRRVISNNYRKFVMMVIVATIPTALLGFFSRHLVEAAGSTLLAPGIGLLITGILLLVVDFTKHGSKIPKDATYANSMWIGICQGLSVLPGISRSGMTIAASLLSGFGRKFAVKYSFIMAIPAIIGAVILELTQIGEVTVDALTAVTYLSGAVVAGVVGFFAIKYMIRIVQKKRLCYFSYYCFIMGAAAIIGNFI